MNTAHIAVRLTTQLSIHSTINEHCTHRCQTHNSAVNTLYHQRTLHTSLSDSQLSRQYTLPSTNTAHITVRLTTQPSIHSTINEHCTHCCQNPQLSHQYTLPSTNTAHIAVRLTTQPSIHSTINEHCTHCCQTHNSAINTLYHQ